MQHRGSSDSRATADSHCEAQGSRNEVKCHGNVSAEMSFNLVKRSCGEGLMSRWFGMRQRIMMILRTEVHSVPTARSQQFVRL